jgi:flagellar biosynthetic protein FlhB
MRHSLDIRLPPDLTIGYVTGIFKMTAARTSSYVLPILIAAVIFSLSSFMVQGGFLFSTQALSIKLGKLNPAQGVGKLFSKSGLMEILKGIAIVSVASAVCYRVVMNHASLYPRLVLMDARKLFYWITQISYEVFIRMAFLLIVIAIGDYAFQKYRYKEQMKMSKQDVKDEYKEMEGNPQIKSRIRKIQREVSRRRMMSDVPTADVVITNPTHYAVALSYKVDSMDAPRVVAKGVGFLALKIKELAQNNGVPLVENRPLAQTLYKTVEIGEFIPGSLYKAVAEILAFVYKAKSNLY